MLSHQEQKSLYKQEQQFTMQFGLCERIQALIKCRAIRRLIRSFPVILLKKEEREEAIERCMKREEKGAGDEKRQQQQFVYIILVEKDMSIEWKI